MPQHHDHFSDETLLAGLDGELPSGMRAAYEDGIASCEACGRRAAQLAHASADIRALLRGASTDEDGQRTARSRARLTAALQDASMGIEPSWLASLRSFARPTPRRALAAALVLACVVGLTRLTRPAGDQLDEAAVRAALPVPSLTPGAWSSIHPDELCSTTVVDAPPVPGPVRAQVLASYGMQHVPADQYELDYLVTPELGGVPDPRNLWPQPYVAEPWNAFVKDELERLLSNLVCSGRLELRVAQLDMAQDWVAAYRKYFRTRDPLRTHVGVRPEFVTVSAH